MKPKSISRVFENLSDENMIKNENFNSFKQEWFSSSEAAEYLRIPVGSLRNMISNGIVKPSGKIGRLNRFHINDLKELLTRK